jgi:MFS family permease
LGTGGAQSSLARAGSHLGAPLPAAAGSTGSISKLSHSASALAPLGIATFRSLWMATMASNLGNMIQAVGAGWMMTTLTDSHNMVALVQGANVAPIMLFSIVAGALADNFDRRTIMLTAQAMMLGFSLLLAVFAFLGLLTPWLLLAFTFLIGCGTALHNPSFHASLGDFVPRSEMPAAVSLNNLGLNAMRSFGPAVGGALIAMAGVTMAFAVNAVSYVPLIVALWRWKPVIVPRTLPRERLPGAVAAGIRYMAMSPKLMIVVVRGLVFGAGAVSVLALMPSVAREYLSGDPLTYGTMLGSFGVGAIGGALLNARLRAHFGNESIIRIACLGLVIGCAGLGLSRDSILTHLALLPTGAFWVIGISLLNTTIQLSTPRWVVGRAIAIYQTAVFGGMALGSWAWGLVADMLGLDTSLLISGAVMLLCAALGFLLPLPAFGTANFDPSETTHERPPRLDIRQRAEPMRIMAEYVIAPEDIPAFLKLMTERRMIRIRDGARRWALLRDLDQPDLWLESYLVPSWVDYVRHRQRRTQGDLQNRTDLLLLHRASDPPRIRRMVERHTVPEMDDTPIDDAPLPGGG